MLVKDINQFFRKCMRHMVLLIKRIMCEEILVLGDSHAWVFKHEKFLSVFPSIYFNIVIVGGATVSGLENPNSKTQTLSTFRRSLQKSNSTTKIILLGEVDAGFVIWYRAEKYKCSVASMLDMAVNNYCNLLIEIARSSRVICISAPLPTIQDGNNWGEIANARKEVKATQLERTKLTIDFNRRIQSFCEKNGLYYISLDNRSLGDDGLVVPYLLNTNPTNHHYDIEKYSDLIIDELLLIVEQVGALGQDSTINRSSRALKQET